MSAELLSFNKVGKYAHIRAKVKDGDAIKFPVPSEIDEPTIFAQGKNGQHVSVHKTNKESTTVKLGKNTPETEVYIRYQVTPR